MRIFLFFMLMTSSLLLMSCEQIALTSTPKKKPIPAQSALAKTAEERFFTILHEGAYDEIPAVDKLLTASYLENPNDPKLAAHLGFLHIWKIAERQRLQNNDPLIVNEIILAKKYFADSVLLDPKDARYLGFFGASQLMSGNIFHDEREQVRGYFTLKKAMRAWPQFNYFTAGYVMSTLPSTSKQFKEGLAWLWATLDVCAKTKVDRMNPDFSPYLHLETQQGLDRACWNSWIAPHNFEGFFLNMGDMLVKSGDWQTGIKIYRNAKLSKTYSTWPYRSLLEKRIADAQANVAHFNAERPAREHAILFNSGFNCAVCHQVK